MTPALWPWPTWVLYQSGFWGKQTLFWHWIFESLQWTVSTQTFRDLSHTAGWDNAMKQVMSSNNTIRMHCLCKPWKYSHLKSGLLHMLPDSDIQGAVFSSLHNIYTKKTYNSKMRTISSSSSKASWRLMSLQWWRWFMMSISLRIKAFSMACPMGMNLAAYTCWVFSSLQRWTCKGIVTKILKSGSAVILSHGTVPEFLWQKYFYICPRVMYHQCNQILQVWNMSTSTLAITYFYQNVPQRKVFFHSEFTVFVTSSIFSK